MYLLRINPRESTKWIAPPPKELVTTEKVVRGEISVAETDLERNSGSRVPEMTTSPTA
jgi:SP family sugar:H+ symporter-like MFS transporter